MVANHALGMWITLAHVLLARVLRFRIVLYHHTYNYINKRSPLMGLIQRLLGPRDQNVVLSDGMGAKLMALYGGSTRMTTVGNGFILPHTEPGSSPSRREVVRLGHLSNLSGVKGIDDVVETCRALVGKGIQCELHVAGPQMDDRARVALSEAASLLGTALKYWGSLGPEEKKSFYESIDVFLFPSRYAAEAYPLVLLEALGAGVPVLSTSRGCIPEMLGGHEEFLITPQGSFAAIAADRLERWGTVNGVRWVALKDAARELASRLRSASRSELEEFLSDLCSGDEQSTLAV